MMGNDPQLLADRFAAQWNLGDRGERRAVIEGLWAVDGVHLLHPPVEIREIAAGLGFDHSVLEARGYDAIEIRVARSYERFVEGLGFTFRARPGAVRVDGVVRVGWEAVGNGTGEVMGGGVDMLVLDGDGRIKTDYMFPGV